MPALEGQALDAAAQEGLEVLVGVPAAGGRRFQAAAP